jgi:branched-chain amino acid transport system ATP-binding protein
LLSQAGLTDLADQLAANLPYGAKKRLELAMVLAGRPGLLLLDEPAAGLAEQERGQLMRWVRQLADSGLAVLYTEHNMDAVAGVADEVLVLIEGRLAARGPFEVVAGDPVVQARYLGRRAEAAGGRSHA